MRGLSAGTRAGKLSLESWPYTHQRKKFRSEVRQFLVGQLAMAHTRLALENDWSRRAQVEAQQRRRRPFM